MPETDAYDPHAVLRQNLLRELDEAVDPRDVGERIIFFAPELAIAFDYAPTSTPFCRGCYCVEKGAPTHCFLL